MKVVFNHSLRLFSLSALIGVFLTPFLALSQEEGDPGAGFEAERAVMDRLELNRFRVAQISAFQAGGDSYSGILSWEPSFDLANDFALRVRLGGSLFQGEDGLFPVLDTALMAAFWVQQEISLEAGPGAQVWFGEGGAHPSVHVGGVYHFDEKIIGIMSGVFFGYTGVFISDLFTQELRVGATLEF
jgi:hypothetical protein